MTELPSGWATATVGELAQAVRGLSYKKEQARAEPGEGLAPLLRATNIQEGSLLLENDLVFIPEPLVRDEQWLQVGDVVLASSSGSASVVGKSAPILRPWHGTFGAFCTVLRPSKHVDPRFLAHFVSSPEVRARWSGLAAGTSINNLRSSHVAETEVPLPPLKEQGRIVTAIEEQFTRLDAAERSVEGVMLKARVLRNAVVAKALHGPWPSLLLGEIAAVDSGPAFKSESFGGPSDGVRLLRGENIEPGQLRWRDTRTWPESKLPGYENLFVAETDVILAMDRPVISTGLKLAPVRASDLPALLVQRVARVRPSERITTPFLHLALQLPRFVSHLLRGQTGTQLPHITLAGIRAFEIPVPPLEEQLRIVAEVEQSLSVIDAMRGATEAAKRRSTVLRPLILWRAFRGELIPQDPDEEPASVLLEQMAVERVAAGSKKGRRVPA